MRDRAQAIVGLLALVVVTACDAVDGNTGIEPIRETLPNGAISLRYPALPDPMGEPVSPSLTIGVVEGDPDEMFGNIRGVEVDSAGNIYILDYQTAEIRAFGPDGRYLRTLTRQGEGPGELKEANGMVLTKAGTIWAQDHGQWRMIELSLDGEEIRRFPMHVLSYGYIWSGTVDDRGRIWKPASHRIEPRTAQPETGLIEGSSRSFLKWFDPETEQSDSVFLGVSTHRTFVTRNSQGGRTFRMVPFAPRRSLVVDPAGGFWAAGGDAYRIARMDDRGDTVLVLEVDIPPGPITDEDRQAFVDRMAEDAPEERRLAEELVQLAPATKAAIDQLSVDDEGRLWVRRQTDPGETPVYDVFDRAGEYEGSLRLGFEPWSPLSPRVRNGHLYAVVTDELDVQTVVRAELPPLGRQD